MKFIGCKNFRNMGESPVEGSYKNNKKECTENFDSSDKEPESVDRLKGLVGSALKSGQVHEVFDMYIASFSSDVLDHTFLELFVYELVQKAKGNLSKKESIHLLFLCDLCGQIMTDPVTLKCGHTFSKKCMLSTMNEDYFDCHKCTMRHSRAYLLQLKNNVLICELIEKLWGTKEVNNKRISSENKYDSLIGLPSEIPNAFIPDSETHSEVLSTSSSMMIQETEDTLVSIEAIKFDLICLALNSKSLQAKENLMKVFQNFLLICRKNGISCSISEDISEKNFSVQNQATVEDNLKHSIPCDSKKEIAKMLPNKSEEIDKMHMMLDNIYGSIEDLAGKEAIPNMYNASTIDKKDFECALCKWSLWEPVSTPCGHTFCRVCLNRCLDHQTSCPLCKTSITCYLAERINNPTELVELAVKILLPDDFKERKEMFEKEMEELLNAGKDTEHVVPLFICTMAFPTVPCLLHIFEPRYRLMIRQCMESGSKQFGMCAYVDNNMAEFGTMLEIGDVQYFEDGRSVVYTVGTQRFRVLSRGERDGYNIGAVEFLKDEPLTGVNLEDVVEMHDQVHKISQSWFIHLPRETRNQILQHFGPMPETEANYLSSKDGPSWFWWMLAVLPIETRSQLMILSMTSLPHRLKTLYRVLLHLQSTLIA